MDDGVLAEGRGAQEMVDRLSIDGEPRLPITNHHSSVGVYSEEITHVAFLGLAVSTFSAFSRENRQDMVSRSETGHTLPHTLHNSNITKPQSRPKNNSNESIDMKCGCIPSCFVAEDPRKHRSLALQITVHKANITMK